MKDGYRAKKTEARENATYGTARIKRRGKEYDTALPIYYSSVRTLTDPFLFPNPFFFPKFPKILVLFPPPPPLLVGVVDLSSLPPFGADLKNNEDLPFSFPEPLRAERVETRDFVGD